MQACAVWQVFWGSVALVPALVAAPDGWQVASRVEARVMADSNVFLQDPAPLQAGQNARGCRVRADDVEGVLGVGYTFTRLSGSRGATAGSAGAAPSPAALEFSLGVEAHGFENYTAENHTDYRAGFAARGAAWDVRLDVLEIDGAGLSPVYNALGGTPALGGAGVRARRDQTLVTGRAALTQTLAAAWRWRATAALLAQDFHTVHAATPVGYANYVDRGQALAGLGLGRTWSAPLPATAWFTVQAGRQWQEDLLGVRANYTNTLVRPLLGVELQPAPSWKASLTAGPDLRTFTGDRPGGDRQDHRVPYLEGATTWTPTKTDTVTFSGRQQLWLGGGGRSAYREIKTDLCYTRRWSPSCESSVSGGILHGNFAGYSAGPRHETIYTVGLTSGVRLSAQWRVEAAVSREWAETEVAATPGRAYTRWLGTLGVTWRR